MRLTKLHTSTLEYLLLFKVIRHLTWMQKIGTSAAGFKGQKKKSYILLISTDDL